jgi:hypothetical protein
MPVHWNFCIRVYDLGWCRPWAVIQRRKDVSIPVFRLLRFLIFALQVQPTPVVLLNRRGRTNSLLLPRTAFPTLILAIRQHSRLLRRRQCHASCYWYQLLVLDNDWFHFPMVDASFPLPLVDALQLHSVCRPRRRRRIGIHCHLLHAAVPKKRDHRVEHGPSMVGQYW